jgi:hypothetical protein
VLENDAEYQRWKITRKNLESTGRDREAQAKRREQLDAIRNKALADLGPQAPGAAAAKSLPVQMASAPQAVNPPAPSSAPSAPSAQPLPSRQSWDINIPGTSPVGPLAVLVTAWWLRRKRQAA